jgi:TolB-like protein/cytochrome c-type biogenesis protein CcmH/NrfG
MNIKRILAQLQQRRVTRVAAIYAAAAWALLQVADVMFPIVGLSEAAITMVLFLALAGFPVSLVLSWVFDFSPTGIRHTSDSEIDRQIERFRLTPARLTAIMASLLLFVVVGYLYLERLSETRQSLLSEEEDAVPGIEVAPATQYAFEHGGRPSIAVLPFLNFSDVPDMEHFGDGLAEEILNLLAKLDELNVAARTSSFYFKDKDYDIPTIAQHLRVRYVLEGSVRHSGNQIRVTAQLIDASNGFHLWSETYDRDPSNIFSVQDDIGREVVNSLQVLLSSESQKLLERRQNIDPDAYDFYLRGRDYLRRPGDSIALQSAESMFQRAVEMSPDYAEAHAGLCDTMLKQYAVEFVKERFNAAEEACQRALELDSNSSAVHIALGNLYRQSGQFTLAEREFNRALSIKSTAVDAYVGLAEALLAQEKNALAEQTLVHAIEMEPNNWAASMAMGRYLFNAGRLEEAIRYYERIDNLMPESNVAANYLGSVYFLLGRFEAAAEAWEKALRGKPDAELYANLGSSYFFLGRYDEAVTIYRKALDLAPELFENWGNLADAYRYSSTQSDLAPAAYEKAIELAEQHIRINPSDAVAIAALGHYQACLGKREQSLENINLAQELAQKDMFVYYFSATALCALNEQDEALSAVHRALSLGYPMHMVAADAGLSSLKKLPEYRAAITESIQPDMKITKGDSKP